MEDLKQQIIEHADKTAWSLVFASLCSNSPSAGQLLERHSTKKVLGIAKGISEPAIPLMAKQHAWNASAVFDYGGFTTSFWINEACIRSMELRLVAGAWLITALSESCD